MTGILNHKKPGLFVALGLAAIVALVIVVVCFVSKGKKGEEGAQREQELKEAYKRIEDPIYKKASKLDSENINKAQSAWSKAVNALEAAIKAGAPAEEIARLEEEVKKAEDNVALARERAKATIKMYARMEQDKALLAENEKHREAQRAALANLAAAEKALDEAKASGASDEEIAKLTAAVEDAAAAFEASQPRAVQKTQKKPTENLKN
ncbi:MAG: hypothetical protein IJQ34_00615 [Kiritimatiellae bacterium]|nr:hypothetical protein [Kiritimatiellia bacterium]